MSLVSNNIKYLRKLAGLTQEQFSRRIGIKRSLVGAYEEARANPNHDNLIAMAKTFNVTVDMLLKQDLQRLRQTPELSIPLDGQPPEPMPVKAASASVSPASIQSDNPFADDPDDPFALLAASPDPDFTKPKSAPRSGPRPNKPDPQPIAAVVERTYGSAEPVRPAPARPVANRPAVVVPPVMAPGARSLVSEPTQSPVAPVYPVPEPDRIAEPAQPTARPSQPAPLADVRPAPTPRTAPVADVRPAPPVSQPVPAPTRQATPQPESFSNQYEPAPAQPVMPMGTPNETSVHAAIPYVQQFQLAEYRQRHLQPDYLSRLPTMRLPNLPVGHYRAFEADSDFMFPGALLIGQFVRNWFEITEGKLYVMLVQSPRPDESGVFCRRVLKQVQPQGTLLLVADRPPAPTREVALKDVLEVWEVRAFVSQLLPDPTPNLDRIRQLADELRYEVERIR